MRQSECPECGGRDLFETVEPTSARGSNGPDLLPGLGSLFHPAKVRVLRDYGLALADGASSAERRRGRSLLEQAERIGRALGIAAPPPDSEAPS